MMLTCPLCAQPLAEGARRCPYCDTAIRPAEPPELEDEAGGLAFEEIDDGVQPVDDADRFLMDYLHGPDLRGAFLAGADLFDANLAGADLRGADLGDAVLSSANLSRADLTGANLFGADLTDANLNGADLRDADLTGANLVGASYDQSTLWPDGFDPQRSGAVRVAAPN